MSSSALQRAEVPLPPLRLMLDIEHERTDARMRLSAAVIAAGAGAWLAWVDTSPWLRLTALISLLFAARFIASYRKVRRKAPSAASHYLEITTERVTIAQGAHHRTIPRERVTRVELDEDRIAVLLCLSTEEQGTEETVAIEPVYGGLGLRELAETLHRYCRARSRLGCTELNP